MKQITFLSISLLLAMSAFSQDITGEWNGVLNQLKLRLVFHINKTGETYTATMDSPDQKAFGIPVDTIAFDGSKLSLSIKKIAAPLFYEGDFKTDSIDGTFKQGVLSIPMTLTRTPQEVKSIVRPQDPKPPYPYISEDVTFENKSAGIALAGTITLPSTGNNFPAVILITGSGPQNRNEELLGHKPFLVLSDFLTRNGIAVLRYDDRGVGGSGGNYLTAGLDDFASDAAAAVNYLKTRKEISPKKIGIIGHSEGGTVAFMLAGKKNSNLAYIVSMAGMAIPGDSLLRMQRNLLYKAMGLSDDDIAKVQTLMDTITNIVNKYPEDYILRNMDRLADEALPDSLKGNDAAKEGFQKAVKQMMTPEMKSILNNNPADALTKVKCPVLALNGEKDLQVPADINLERIKALVKSRVTVKKYPGLNHLFQHCTTGLPAEYGLIEETISPEVLSDIAKWIKEDYIIRTSKQ